jgi:hypothetical protein
MFDPGIVPSQCHNCSVSNLVTMEADCQDAANNNGASLKQEAFPDLNQFLSAITSKITAATTQMSNNDFHTVISANTIFKQEVRDELTELRMLISQQQQPLRSTPSVPTGIQTHFSASNPSQLNHTPVSGPSLSPGLSNVPTSTLPTTTDQVLQMLTDSFAKMATALTEKQGDSKAEWPKFSGDAKKFRSWYLAIMTQLSITPWRDLYDSSTNNVVTSTSNTTLNEKLYSKVILALEGSALQHVVSRKHLRANGLAVLQDLVHTYRPKNVPEVIAAKTAEFWGTMKRQPHETVDTYFNRFHELLDDLAEADEPISTKSALRQFLFTLGPEFEPIQHNYRINNLPTEWKTQDWTQFLVLCGDYYNSVKPTSSDRKPSSDILFDKEAHQKKVKN